MSTFTKRVIATNDDTSRSGSSYFPSDVALTVGGAGFFGDRYVYVRFTNITLNQGTTITSAKITFQARTGDSNNVLSKIYGLDVDNVGDFEFGDPTGDTRTTANADWDVNGITGGNNYDTSNIGSIVQEIINRGGWSSGNAIGFVIVNDGTGDGIYHDFDSYDGDSINAPLLTIEYSGSSPSASVSPSSSTSPSSSASLSPSASPSSSFSPSPSQGSYFGMKVAKTGYNVLTTFDPTKLIFDSNYGTLKYFDKQTAQITVDADDGDIAGTISISHNLGYYPYIEVYVNIYRQDVGTDGHYEYVPFMSSGVSVVFDATYKITTTGITLYAGVGGVATGLWVFDFIVFIYKNNLNL